MKKDIEFVDAQQMKKLNPKTFEAPDEIDLKGIHVGDTVKVCAFKERFWVEITEINGDIITGRVDNILVTPLLKYNETIQFEARHIYDIWEKERMQQKGQKAVEEMKKRIIISQRKGHRRL